jgi:tetratricopeptide (TPR) repeat protein
MNSAPIEHSAAPLDAACELYERGLILQAYRASESLGPLRTWRGAGAQVLGGRLASHLGAPRLANWLMRNAWRSDPHHAEAQYFYGYSLFRLRGPYPAWRWMQQRLELPADAEPETTSSWYALLAEVAGTFRDFEVAERYLQDADAAMPDSPWVLVCRAHIQEMEDRYDESLSTARRALDLRSWYRPAVQSIAHLLSLLDRDAEALQLLAEASRQIESNSVVGQLYALQLELRQYREARESLDRFQELSPLAEKNVRQWLAAQRSEVAYRLGDDEAAIRYARESDDDFFKTVAERMQEPARAGAKEVQLPVGFVRQHHVTCVPATLAAISRYWSMPADHLQVADEICYNGTSNYSERRWAAEHGWVAREFTVTETSAAALLDQGIPFTFATVDPGSAHLQAVIGYDGRRGTLLIRDPYWRNAGEAIADKVLQRYRAYGPRGMALVPAGERARLEAIDLPDAAIWDELHALDGALVAHRRDEARAVYARMLETAPGHLLTREARRRLALYDSNPTEHLAAVGLLLEVNPEDQSLQLERLSCLRDLARREERLATYHELCRKKDTHPLFWQQYGQELRVDARRHGDAVWLLRRAIRRWPSEAANYYVLANLYADQRRFDESLELYRMAMCLGDKEEQFAHAYFSAATYHKQTDTALDLLRDRFARFGRKSSLPARTLFAAYMQLDRTTEALQVLEQAMQLRPDDGELLLFAADGYLSCSMENMPRATALLENAKDRAPAGVWLRTAARLTACDGRLEDALGCWRQVLETQPLAIDAHRAVTRLLAETQGRAAALAHLEQMAARFPHHHPLHELWIEWMRDEPRETREPVIRQVLALNPDDAWVRRELALVLADQRRFDEAEEQLAAAGQLDPLNPSYHLVRAHVLQAQQRIDEARTALRQAIELSVDNDLAISELVDLCPTLAERRAVLAFVKDQLVRQVIYGDGLLAFRLHARGALDAEELLAALREALAARPDLWHAWSAVTTQLLDMNRVDEAWELSGQATERFPLVPRLWLDRAAAARAREDDAGELDALQTAYRISPGWGYAVRALCDFHERHGDFGRSRQLLEQAVARDPLEAPNHLMLAEALWREGEREAAFERVHRLVQQEPGFDQAWGLLNAWSDELGCPERTLATVRELTVRRGGEARSWLMLSKVLDAPDQREERLAALDRAIALNPRCAEAYDLRATTLARDNRWEEALAACRPTAWPEQPPVELRVRAAWIENLRGHEEEALRQMRAVVQEEPHYFDAWSQLAEWYQQRQDKAGFLEAAEALVRISPHYDVSLGCLGEARMMNEDRAGAREAFRRAFELNPAYQFAGNALFDLQLEDNDVPGAAATLATLRTHGEGPYVTARAVQLAVKQGDPAAGCDALRGLCTMECESPWPIGSAVQTLVEAGQAAAVEGILEQQLAASEAHPEVGVQWVKRRVARKDWECGRRLRELSQRGDLGRQATYAYIEALLQSPKPSRLLRFLRENGDWLRADTFTWGSMCYGLAGLREFRKCARWAADWREREDAAPWMLVNVLESLRAIGDEATASEVSARALDLPPAHGQHLLHLWLAADKACRGDVAAAEEHLAAAGSSSVDTDYAFLRTLTEGMLEVAKTPPADRPRVFPAVRRRIDALRMHYAAYSREPARRQVYRRCLARLAADRGGLVAFLWRWLRWLNS